jgi:hypothetical protein
LLKIPFHTTVSIDCLLKIPFHTTVSIDCLLKIPFHTTVSIDSLFACLIVVNATFNNISTISWRLVLLVEETGGPGENHRPVASH